MVLDPFRFRLRKVVYSRVFAVILSFVFVVSITGGPVFAKVQDWEDSGCMIDGVPTLKCLEVVYGNLLFVSAGFVMMILFVMWVLGGVTYLTSLGEPAKVEKAQNIIKWALLGTILFVSSYALLRIIDIAFLGGQGVIFRLNIPGPDGT